jgi:hypothetical protein
MVDQSQFNNWVRVITALALMVAVTTSLIRPQNLVGASWPADHARRDFASPSEHSARLTAASVPSRLGWVKAIRSEMDEEDLSGMARPADDVFDLCPPQSPIPCGHFWTTGDVRSFHPLRC